MSRILIQEAVTLVCTDDGPNNNKHLTLESLSVPEFTELSEDYLAGGAIGRMTLGLLALDKLEVTFKLKGHDPQVMSQFGLGTIARTPWTYYGVLRDKKTNKAIEVRGLVEGRLGRVTSDEQQRGALSGHEFMLHEIVLYELTYDKKEKYFYDYFNSLWRVDGVVQNKDHRQILRIG